jgi:ribosomal subunit interface protein
MKYNIRGNKIEVTEAINDYIKSKLSKIEKYLDDGNRICYYVSDSDNVSFTTYRTNYPGYYNDNNNDYYVQDGDGSYYYEEDYNY